LAYDDGEIDLDALLPKLAARACYLVAETLEADNNRALNMRDAQRRMLRVLGRPAGV
jgi:hypothetical protein